MIQTSLHGYDMQLLVGGGDVGDFFLEVPVSPDAKSRFSEVKPLACILRSALLSSCTFEYVSRSQLRCKGRDRRNY